ncbi:MAG: guanylate kinase [Candidatus Dadabacteria bacterium]|nr:guanylate kinase [Candidatus Dadabacteria bacterium]NIS07754.1 guanylate kinase [Candidatus Dadabacteria bacterium]NIV40993.1 guanylate kinase [Candidatus Dadabacteria bacterium]NIX14406.1 guanylate kinase [Candidatus Dadabacteria bacterium]NIY20918.1 guanylate kinase [Candidatus Dadabacteria bacterium]
MLFVISGPSGSGKTTLTKKLVEQLDNLQFVTSYTTRKPRKGEKNGVDYVFVSEDKFARMVKENKFIEWAFVHGNYYGTPYDVIKKSERAQKDVLLDINIEGAFKIKNVSSDGIYVFLKPPSLEILRQRLIDRNDLSEYEISKRMEVVRKEIEKSSNYDYIIVNSELEYSFNKLVDIINKERSRKKN